MHKKYVSMTVEIEKPLVEMTPHELRDELHEAIKTLLSQRVYEFELLTEVKEGGLVYLFVSGMQEQAY